MEMKNFLNDRLIGKQFGANKTDAVGNFAPSLVCH